MILTLEVTGPQAGALGHARRKEFGPEGGTIGRLPDNDWVLSEPYVSGRHAIIRFMDGVFHIEDTSTNGVFLNSSSERIVRGRLYPIKTGDRIVIDPYDILVQVAEGAPRGVAAAPRDNDNPFADFGQPVSDSFLQPAPLSPLEGLGL
jgi:type VI secretion system FHA domain protein